MAPEFFTYSDSPTGDRDHLLCDIEEVSGFSEALDDYLQGLTTLVKYIDSSNPRSILSLGYSAGNMVRDLHQLSESLDVSLPAWIRVVGQPAWNLYSGEEIAIETYREIDQTFEETLLLEDFFGRGTKIVGLHKSLIVPLDLKVSIAVLSNTAAAEEKIRKQGVDFFSVFKDNDNLQELLNLRRTSTMQT